MGFIQKLTKDAATANQELTALATWNKELSRLQQDRVTVLERRWKARARIALLRNAFANKASNVLGTALKDLTLNLKYVEDGHSPDAEALITAKMGWKTVQVPRAGLFVRKLTIPKLLEAIRQQKSSVLTGLQSADGVSAFSKTEADAISARLKESDLLHALERVEIDDLPKLTVTKTVYAATGLPSLESVILSSFR